MGKAANTSIAISLAHLAHHLLDTEIRIAQMQNFGDICAVVLKGNQKF